MIHRRKLITGLISLVAAPAIVRAGSLMPVKALVQELNEQTLEEMLVGLAPIKAEGAPIFYDGWLIKGHNEWGDEIGEWVGE